MKRALIIIAIILLIAAVVGVVLIGGLMMNNYAKTGSVFGSGFDISGGFWENIIGDEVLDGIDTSPLPTETDEIRIEDTEDTEDTKETDQEKPADESVFIYELLDDGTYAVQLSLFVSDGHTVYYPSTYNDVPVTAIFETISPAKKDKVRIQSIVIPDSVTIIQENAFAGLKNLTDVTFGKSVLAIERAAFANCPSIVSIELPESLQLIGDEAFKNCTALTTINLPQGLTHIGDSAFEECKVLDRIVIP